ncbi:MAG: hypothetical protein H0Z34_12460 [Brevibacillus sp.]|nr:hypothetical protein [Brevibacillus sp.]
MTKWELKRQLERCEEHRLEAEKILAALHEERRRLDKEIIKAQDNVNHWSMMVDDTINDIRKLEEGERHAASA